MLQQERMDRILTLVRQNGFVTVKFLCDELDYSTATINRDLNQLEQMKLIRRSYGGVETIEEQGISLKLRYDKSKPEKKRIGKRAAEFVEEGDIIFVDGSTTAQSMGAYLVGIKGITVITNNMALAIYLSERGVSVVVLGGMVTEAPFMLDGVDAVDIASRYHADKCFLSVESLDEKNGIVGHFDDTYLALHRVMLNNSDRSFLLADGGKIGHKYTRCLCELSRIDCVISDRALDGTLTERFPSVEFVVTEK